MSLKRNRRYAFLKRLLDIVFSALLLFLLGIPMLIIGVMISATSEGGALFKQKRVGRHGEMFTCYKFRTMYIDAPDNCPKATLKNAERYITPIGGFLRKSSLDELPQLYNVLRGDMSLVGPRPLIAEEGEIHELRRRCGVLDVRPGITGLAQVSGRDRVSDVDKARYDIDYIRGMSLGQDAGIILKTVGDVLYRRDMIK